jgi:hypothetical protein
MRYPTPVTSVLALNLSNPYTIYIISGIVVVAWLALFLLLTTGRDR